MQNSIGIPLPEIRSALRGLGLIGRHVHISNYRRVPSLLLPPIMNTLKQEYVKNGLD